MIAGIATIVAPAAGAVLAAAEFFTDADAADSDSRHI
ncbi:MAG: hypothetical protein BWY46_01809 [Firmicutes bacterium ADurb.Bin300]|nr:MAG: hypothetical protein BWY46_01809 [Firmicutes bacterium ADurb.Bin300]